MTVHVVVGACGSGGDQKQEAYYFFKGSLYRNEGLMQLQVGDLVAT